MPLPKSKPNLRLVKGGTSSSAAPVASPGRADSAYYREIENYAHRIRRSDDISHIIGILDEAIHARAAEHDADKNAPALVELMRAERQIDALRQELESVRRLVQIDHLTGTLNRSALEQSFAREAARAERRGTPLGVALLDIDDFKHLNDRHGHQAGDAALVHLTQVIRATVRPSDVVVRYGGEEFLFLFPDSGLEQSATALCRLQHDLDNRPLRVGESELSIAFSAGVTVRKPGEAHEAVIANADRALYAAKRAGKRRVLSAH